MSMEQPEELDRAIRSFAAKIIRAKRTTIQDIHADDGMNDQAERNKEPPD